MEHAGTADIQKLGETDEKEPIGDFGIKYGKLKKVAVANGSGWVSSWSGKR